MSDDQSSPDSRSWLERIGDVLGSNEPKTKSDLLSLLKDAEERGLLDIDTYGMVEGAMQVSEMQVRDAMIPRGQMVCLPQDGDLTQLLPIIVESGHSRFPVIRDDKDEIVGILLAKDLLRSFQDPSIGNSVQNLIRPAVFIPESKRLNVLLKEFRDSRNHMAIVVDEYGGVAGLITIEDVLEEIVGEIDDEHDDEESPLIRRQENGRFTVQALTPIEDFNGYFETGLSDETFDTIGGLITGELGRVPEKGEVVQVGELEFEVLRTDSRRLLLLGVEPSRSE